MKLKRQMYLFRREIQGVLNRTIVSFRKSKHFKKKINVSKDYPGAGTKIIWSTLVTSKRQEELEIAYFNLRNLEPVLAWSSLTLDGTSNDIKLFIQEKYKGGFDNLL